METVRRRLALVLLRTTLDSDEAVGAFAEAVGERRISRRLTNLTYNLINAYISYKIVPFIGLTIDKRANKHQYI